MAEIVTTTAQEALDAAKEGAVRLTLVDGDNGPLEILAGTGDVVVEAPPGKTARLTRDAKEAPITVIGRRLVLDGSKGEIETDAAREITGVDEIGVTTYAGEAAVGLITEGSEVVILGKGGTKGIDGMTPGVTRAPYRGRLERSGDYVRQQLAGQAVTILVPVDGLSDVEINERLLGHVYREPEA